MGGLWMTLGPCIDPLRGERFYVLSISKRSVASSARAINFKETLRSVRMNFIWSIMGCPDNSCTEYILNKLLLLLLLFVWIHPTSLNKSKAQNRLLGCACPCSGKTGLENLETAELSSSAWVYMQRDRWVHKVANGKMAVKEKKPQV